MVNDVTCLTVIWGDIDDGTESHKFDASRPVIDMGPYRRWVQRTQNRRPRTLIWYGPISPRRPVNPSLIWGDINGGAESRKFGCPRPVVDMRPYQRWCFTTRRWYGVISTRGAKVTKPASSAAHLIWTDIAETSREPSFDMGRYQRRCNVTQVW